MKSLALMVLVIAGCGATVVGPSPNDAMRRDLQSAVNRAEALQQQNQELQQQLATAMTAGSFDHEAIKALPTVTAVVFKPDPVIENRNGSCWVVARIETLDGRGRFTQAVGTVGFRVFALGGPAGNPALVAESFAGPLQVRESYRSGVMGTYYAFEIPLLAGTPCQGPLSVLCVYEDALTKVRHESVGNATGAAQQVGP